MVPKWSQSRPKIWLFRRLSLEVFFSGLKSLLKLIFASTAGPANLDFCNTFLCFWRFFHFSEDRVENDFEVIFDLPKLLKNLPKSTKSGPQNSEKKQYRKKVRFFHQNCLQKGVQKSIKISKNGWGTLTRGTFYSTNHANNRFWTLQGRFESILKRSGSHFDAILVPFATKIYQNSSRLVRRNARSD